MQRLRNIVGRVLEVLVCAALVLAPVGTAAAEMPADTEHAGMTDSPPCDMPCDDCTDNKVSFSCVAACSALIAAIPTTDALRLPHTSAHHAMESPNDTLVGREREPDKPPPKLILV